MSGPLARPPEGALAADRPPAREEDIAGNRLVSPVARLTFRGLACTPVEVPLRYVLGTSAATVRAAPLLLVEVLTEEGVSGHSYVFGYRRSGAKAIAQVLDDVAETLRRHAPDLGVVAAYGTLIPGDLLRLQDVPGAQA